MLAINCAKVIQTASFPVLAEAIARARSSLNSTTARSVACDDHAVEAGFVASDLP